MSLPTFPGDMARVEVPDYGLGVEIMDDNWSGNNLNTFMYPQHYSGDVEYVLMSHGITVTELSRWLRIL